MRCTGVIHYVRREGVFLQRESVPPGSNQSGGEGNEAVRASGGKGRLGRPREFVGRNVSER